ncbi:hypothetical protein KSX_40470 [Ktedonospora formicarum]|uniref:Uncharacterized protein n=2 Tax=Ktedonospora formicarum TaxID=2778364 RepID=A0A8J3HY49_9CHLR|nr:hypothetical protein KSX_40470 [Ktedonospora formicarum]
MNAMWNGAGYTVDTKVDCSKASLSVTTDKHRVESIHAGSFSTFVPQGTKWVEFTAQVGGKEVASGKLPLASHEKVVEENKYSRNLQDRVGAGIALTRGPKGTVRVEASKVWYPYNLLLYKGGKELHADNEGSYPSWSGPEETGSTFSAWFTDWRHNSGYISIKTGALNDGC